MRRWAIVAFACGGCNPIFGLEHTSPADGPPPQQFGVIRMSQLVGPATAAGDQAPIETVPMADPRGRYAPLDGPFVDVTDYDAERGEFRYPTELANEPWRLEYTPPGDVPHELQWQPAQGAGRVVTAVFGRTPRTQQRPNTGFEVSPPSLFFPTDTKIFTTGYWTATRITAQPTRVNLDFATLAPASGGYGATAADDLVVALGPDATLGECFQRAYVATAVAPAVIDQVMTPVALTSESELDSAVIQYPPTTTIVPYGPFVTRLNVALGARSQDGSGKIYFGRVAHTELPAFTTTLDGDDVPAPLMLPLVWCPVTTSTNPTNFNIGKRIRWRLAAYAFIANERMVSGVRLRSSLATITLKSGDSDDFLLDYPVKLATSPKLGDLDLDAGSDGAALSNAPVDLTFAFEAIPNADVDYFEVTLYRLAGGALEPVRVYVGATAATSAAIRFDPSVMLPNAEYVFAIRTIRGRPGARSYDFLPVTMPQAIATVFTKTFHR